MNVPPPDDPANDRALERLLECWGRQTPPQPCSVAPEVWRRAREAAARPGWLERVNAVFARPSFAAAFVVACVLLGLFLAEARSSRLQAEYGARLAQRYLQLVDPLLGEPGGKEPRR